MPTHPPEVEGARIDFESPPASPSRETDREGMVTPCAEQTVTVDYAAFFGTNEWRIFSNAST